MALNQVSANDAYKKISAGRPIGSLVGFVNLSSILLQIILVVAFQLITFFYARSQSWFVPTSSPDIEKNIATMEGTTLFLISIYQYVTMAFVFSKGLTYSILFSFICPPGLLLTFYHSID